MCDFGITAIILGAVGAATSIAGGIVSGSAKKKAAAQAQVAAGYQANAIQSQYDAAAYGVRGYLTQAAGYGVQAKAYKTQANAYLEAASAYRLQATGALQKGTDTQKIYNMEASVNAQNAKVAHTYAEWTMRKVEQDVYKVQTGASVQVGQQVAAYASGNVDVGVGTPVNVYASTAASAERTSNWLRLAAAEEAYGLNQQAKQYVQLAAIDRYKGAAAVTASKYEAAGMEYAARGQQYAAAGALYAQSGALLGQQGALLAARGAEVARGGLLWQKMAVLAGGQAQAAAYNAGAISDFMGAAAGAFKFAGSTFGSFYNPTPTDTGAPWEGPAPVAPVFQT